MTTAKVVGRRLSLEVDGIDEPFLVDPVPAKRGKYLTQLFVATATGQASEAIGEQLFIEAFGPANYARMGGYYVDVVKIIDQDPDGTITAIGDPVLTYGPDGITFGDPTLNLSALLTADHVFNPRERRADEPELTGEAIRQAEGESLCLCAFYWQTVVGLEAVNSFIEDGEGTTAAGKALTLLLIRLGLYQSANSSTGDSEALTQEVDSVLTPGTPPFSALDRLPANKRGFLNRKNRRTASNLRG